MIDTSAMALPKHCTRRRPKGSIRVLYIGGVWIYPDKREVCDMQSTAGRKEYASRVQTMWMEQGGRCCLGGEPIAPEDASFEHERSRSAGGARQEDRIRDEHGNPINGAACVLHNNEKGSRRVEYKVKRQ